MCKEPFLNISEITAQETSLKSNPKPPNALRKCNSQSSCIFFNWVSIHASQNSLCEAWGYKKKRKKRKGYRKAV